MVHPYSRPRDRRGSLRLLGYGRCEWIDGEEPSDGFTDHDTMLLPWLEVQFAHDGERKGIPMALWPRPVDGVVDLAGTAFSQRGGNRWVRNEPRRAGDDESVTVIAALHEDEAETERRDRG